MSGVAAHARLRRVTTRAAALAVAVAAVGSGSAAAQPPVRLTRAVCYSLCGSGGAVMPGGKLSLSGRGFGPGARVVFTVTRGARTATASGSPRFLRTTLLHVRVPANATSGRLYVHYRRLRSNSIALTVVQPPPPPPTPVSVASGTAFTGNGMWIWYVSQSSGGSIPAIIAQAHLHNIGTVFIKSSDGTSWWSQFNPGVIAQLRAAGLHVCAWQYVYGTHPAIEAQLGIQAATTGADCLAIDAESEYEGRYAQAQQYMADLRQALGKSYPLGLASFPYVDYHPALPYSVFLGPNGAQFDVPQIYWKDIGTSVDNAVSHTYQVNAPYGVPIAPLGQAYNGTSRAEILRFRALALANGSPGVSWWDWQSAIPSQWQAIGQPLATPAARRPAAYLALRHGARGDLVVWAQEHLRGAGRSVPITGSFDSATESAVTSFQAASALPATGLLDTATWTALLRYRPAGSPGGKLRAAGASARNGPASAMLAAKRDEIPPKPH